MFTLTQNTIVGQIETVGTLKEVMKIAEIALLNGVQIDIRETLKSEILEAKRVVLRKAQQQHLTNALSLKASKRLRKYALNHSRKCSKELEELELEIFQTLRTERGF